MSCQHVVPLGIDLSMDIYCSICFVNRCYMHRCMDLPGLGAHGRTPGGSGAEVASGRGRRQFGAETQGTGAGRARGGREGHGSCSFWFGFYVVLFSDALKNS